MKAHSVDPRAEGERKHTQQHRSTSLDRSNKYDDKSNKIRKISHKESSPPDRYLSVFVNSNNVCFCF